MKKTKLQILTRRLVTVFISIILVWGIVLSVSIINKTSNLNVVCSEDDGYYSETTYFSNKYDYEKYCQEKANRENPKTKTAKLANSIETSNEEFVAAAVKSVWVSETVDESGNTLDSHLMTKAEIDKFDAPKENVDDNIVLTDSSPDPFVTIGTDSTGKYLLDIELVLIHNTKTDLFRLRGTAFWEEKLVWAWQQNEAAEEYSYDYMALTWGGEGMCSNVATISGTYYDNSKVNFSQIACNPYCGRTWEFHEKSGYLGKEMARATAVVDIEKHGTPLEKFTYAQLTYIHTYNSVEGEVTVEASKDLSLAASVKFSVIENNWQIQVGIGGIKY